MESLILDPPHMVNAALAVAWRYHLWLINGEPEVWHHVPFKRERLDKKTGKEIPEVPAHWVRIISIDAISRLDAKQELHSAWKQDAEWREAYAK